MRSARCTALAVYSPRRGLTRCILAQRDAAEKFIANKLVPLLKDLPDVRCNTSAMLLLSVGHQSLSSRITRAQVSVRHAVLRFATDADSVGRVVCANAEDLGAAMVVIPSHGKGTGHILHTF